MSLMYDEAYAEIADFFHKNLNGTDLEIFYGGVQRDNQTKDKTKVVFHIKHYEGRQNSLGGVGQRMFIREGVVTVQILHPSRKGLHDAYKYVNVIVNSFEGKATPSGVWFRNTRIKENGIDGEFLLINVITDFQYYEIK